MTTVHSAALGVLCAVFAGCSSTGVVTVRPRALAPAEGRRAAAGADTVRVMTFNLRRPMIIDLHNHWAFRKKHVVKMIRSQDPDVLGTQECVADQAEYLGAELPGYAFVGVGRGDGRRRGEMCGVFYKTARFEKLDEGHFWLSTTPERPGSKSWGAWMARMTTWIKLRPRRGDRTAFYVFNTHFAISGESTRTAEAQLLRRQIEQIAGNAPLIVTGDFNTGEGSDPYRALVNGLIDGVQFAFSPLVDVYRRMHPVRRGDEGTHNSFRGRRKGRRIDWIITSASFRALDATIVRTDGKLPSDHDPVVALLKLEPAGTTAARRGLMPPPS